MTNTAEETQGSEAKGGISHLGLETGISEER